VSITRQNYSRKIIEAQLQQHEVSTLPLPVPFALPRLDNSFDWAKYRARAGWGNGYVAVPPGHPWHGSHYADIDVSVHGGLTYSGKAGGFNAPSPTGLEGWWVVGFDTGHDWDSIEVWPEEAVWQETLALHLQALQALPYRGTYR